MAARLQPPADPAEQNATDNPEILAAREDLFAFCKLKNPKFYKSERAYQVILCRELQDFLESDELVMICNLPPRFGKSYTAQNGTQWWYGKHPEAKIMTASYNETLSKTFARSVRNGIAEKKGAADKIVYSDIFPKTRIAYGESAMQLWAIDGYYASYLATSPGGTATGFGASLIIVDDLIKSAYEAFNANILDAHWDWFVNTLLSRLEEGGKILIIMTRWASGDLAGRATKHFEELGITPRILSMPALQPDGTMLCEDVLSKKSYDMKVASMAPEIASANYNQIPIDLKGALYAAGFETYDAKPGDWFGLYNYTDTADTGADYLCSICYGIHDHKAYVLDLLYTKASMEETEPATARMLDTIGVNLARIESNNGGRGFARAVRRHLEEDHHNYATQVSSFTQHKNKQARILSNSVDVMRRIVMPADWRIRWPEFADAVTKYQKEGKNAHDDAPDVLTGIVETMIGLGV